MKQKLKTLAAMIAFATAAQVMAQDTLPVKLPEQQDSRLEQVATSPRVWNGITVSHDNRLFASLTQSEGAGLQWFGPYISIHFLSLNLLLVLRRRYSRGERYPSALCGCHSL